MGHLEKAFIWQLITRVGEESFAHGLFPTDDEKLSHTESTLGGMLLAGNLALVGPALIAPAMLLAWILTDMATGLTIEQLSAPIEADSGAGVLDRSSAAAATADELRGLGDELLDRYVQAARADGASWSEIGTALGVTKQAAHERFVDARLAWPQNFSDPARVVVARALEEARGFGHRYLGTEHLLLALSTEPDLAGMTLAELGISEHGVRDSIERIIGRGRSGGSAALGITPRTKRVLEAAVREAKRVGRQRCSDSEHLLLALAASDGVARDILAEHGAEEDALRERLASLIEREAPEIAARLRAPRRRGVRRRSRA